MTVLGWPFVIVSVASLTGGCCAVILWALWRRFEDIIDL
jgi:hypothetical protein